MSELEGKLTCWSCGKNPGQCICGNEFIPNLVVSPKVILPFCGGKRSGTEDEYEPWRDPNKFTQVMPRPCCVCDHTWPSTYEEWIYGKCPHCGAKGADGSGGYGINPAKGNDKLGVFEPFLLKENFNNQLKENFNNQDLDNIAKSWIPESKKVNFYPEPKLSKTTF